MSRRSTPLLALLLAVGPSCEVVRQQGGRATLSMARVEAEPGEVWVRPNEVTWTVGEAVEFIQTIDASELGAFVSSGTVRTESGPTLPDHVEMAATHAMIQEGADGFIVTHYMVATTTDASSTRHTVTGWGRLLHLHDLGPMDPERADMRRLLERLEGTGASMPARPTSPLLASAPPLSRPVPAPRPSSTVPQRPRVGFEVGNPVGLVVDFPTPGRTLDAVSLRIGAQLDFMYASSPYLAVPNIVVQNEFIQDAVVQPVLGVGFSLLPAYSAYFVVAARAGVEIDPPGPFELNVGAALGSPVVSSIVDFSPNLSAAWLW